jgi:hypothetical protein
MKEIKYTFYIVSVKTFVIPFYYGSGTVINNGSRFRYGPKLNYGYGSATLLLATDTSRSCLWRTCWSCWQSPAASSTASRSDTAAASPSPASPARSGYPPLSNSLSRSGELPMLPLKGLCHRLNSFLKAYTTKSVPVLSKKYLSRDTILLIY